MKGKSWFFSLAILATSSVASASTPTFDHNSKLGMCTGLSRIANIQIDTSKIQKAINHSEGKERTRGAMTYGGGYAVGLVDMYQTLKPNTKTKREVAKDIFSQTGCKVYI